MLEELRLDIIHLIFGEAEHLRFWHMGSRAVVIFSIALLLIRIAGRRTFGLHAPLDNIIILLLGSILARPIVGASAFIPTVFSALVIVLLHRFLARAGVHHFIFSKITKGTKAILYHNGKFVEANLRYCGVSKDDIHQEIRLKTRRDSLEHIDHIYMERNGSMSFIEKAR